MGAEKGSASGSSKGGMSNKSAETSPVVQGIKADQYARKKLGITPTVSNPNQPLSQSNISGYYSTTSKNQMYGSEYQAARNEYLASQGLGTMQKNGSFTTGVQTDKGLVFTSKAREAYEASKAEKMPLSRQMYDSQKLISSTAFAVMGALIGMPTLGITVGSSIYNKPYGSTVTLGRSNATYLNQAFNNQGNNQSTTTNNTTANNTTATTTGSVTDDMSQQAKYARSMREAAGSARKFYKISGKSITGKMSNK